MLTNVCRAGPAWLCSRQARARASASNCRRCCCPASSWLSAHSRPMCAMLLPSCQPASRPGSASGELSSGLPWYAYSPCCDVGLRRHRHCRLLTLLFFPRHCPKYGLMSGAVTLPSVRYQHCRTSLLPFSAHHMKWTVLAGCTCAVCAQAMPLLQATLQAAVAGRLKLLYVTPECLAMSWVADRLNGLHISLACVDEAHHASERSPTCRPGCLQLPQRLARCAPGAVKCALRTPHVTTFGRKCFRDWYMQ